MKDELICKITDKDIGEISIEMRNPRLRLAAFIYICSKSYKEFT